MSRILSIIDQVRKAGKIDADHVSALRRAIFTSPKISEQEAEALIRLANDNLPADAGWPALFVEALTEYMVNQTEPKGYVTTEAADWLIEKISEDSHIDLETELQLLVKIADTATSCPENFVLFSLDVIRRVVINDSGDMNAPVGKGSVSAREVEMLRTVLYSQSGDGGHAISRAEADILFDIHDAVVESENHPEWYDLFVKAIANHLMAMSGYESPAREEMLRRQAWMEDTSVSILGFFKKAGADWASALKEANGNLGKAIRRIFQPVESTDSRMYRRAVESVRMNEVITDDEAQWLASRIKRNGKIDDNEYALLELIRKEAPLISPLLDILLHESAGSEQPLAR